MFWIGHPLWTDESVQTCCVKKQWQLVGLSTGIAHTSLAIGTQDWSSAAALGLTHRNGSCNWLSALVQLVLL